MTKIEKRTYNWGTLRVIRKNNDFTAVIHPQHFEMIEGLENGESGRFTDEQGYNWKVTKEDDKLKFSTKGAKMTVKSADLA